MPFYQSVSGQQSCHLTYAYHVLNSGSCTPSEWKEEIRPKWGCARGEI